MGKETKRERECAWEKEGEDKDCVLGLELKHVLPVDDKYIGIIIAVLYTVSVFVWSSDVIR